MALLNLLQSRKALTVGVGTTTRRNTVLDAIADPAPIPAREGSAKYLVKRITSVARGFVARIVGATRATLFAHDTLAVADAAYPIYGNTYTVLPFATTYNVADGDTSKLNDVISFLSGDVLVNGIALPMLSIIGAAPVGALPWLIAHPAPIGPLGKYGDSVTNATVKRVFAVGRAAVHSWSNSGIDLALDHAEARSENKAIVCGARVDASSNTAFLSQLWFYGSGWSDLSSVWYVTSAQVAMLLTAPYLEKIGATMPSVQSAPAVVANGSSTSTSTEAITLTGAELAMVGSAELGSASPNNIITEYRVLNFPWTEVFTAPIPGERRYTTTTVSWSGSIDQTYSVSSGLVTDAVHVAATTYTENVSRNEKLGWSAFSVDLPPIDGSSYDQNGYYYLSTNVAEWDSPPGNTVPRGSSAAGGAATELPTIAPSTTHESRGTLSITAGGYALVTGSYRRYKRSGQTIITTPGTRYSPSLSDPYAFIGASSGFGTFSRMRVSLTCGAANVQTGHRTQKIADKCAEFLGGHCYDTTIVNAEPLFRGSLVALDPVDDSMLTWSTTDFILHDSENAVFISVESTFSGTQAYGAAGAATLHIVLKIVTPAGTTLTTLFDRSFSYTELLPETTDSNSVSSIASPRLSVMFTPMFRAQGDFHGADYTTAREVSAGATPTYLINFVLTLGTFGTIADDQPAGPIRFIPCNLIEMLYAYVFSSAYGRDAYDRYPVTFTARFNDLSETLFSDSWRITYRNGNLVDWLDTLGGDYITEQTTELYRT